jgi:hypothetical protein
VLQCRLDRVRLRDDVDLTAIPSAVPAHALARA